MKDLAEIREKGGSTDEEYSDLKKRILEDIKEDGDSSRMLKKVGLALIIFLLTFFVFIIVGLVLYSFV